MGLGRGETVGPEDFIRRPKIGSTRILTALIRRYDLRTIIANQGNGQKARMGRDWAVQWLSNSAMTRFMIRISIHVANNRSPRLAIVFECLFRYPRMKLNTAPHPPFLCAFSSDPYTTSFIYMLNFVTCRELPCDPTHVI
jgi:hypothetical protein